MRQTQFATSIEPKYVECQFSHDAQIGCGLAQVDGAGILAKCHIQAAVQTVASRPEELPLRHRVTEGSLPPPVPTERSVQISRTTLFSS